MSIDLPTKVHLVGSVALDSVAEVKLRPETEVYLSLVHADGAEKTKQRIAAANNYVRSFGIAAECGIARKRKPDLVRSLLQIHADSSATPH